MQSKDLTKKLKTEPCDPEDTFQVTKVFGRCFSIVAIVFHKFLFGEPFWWEHVAQTLATLKKKKKKNLPSISGRSSDSEFHI